MRHGQLLQPMRWPMVMSAMNLPKYTAEQINEIIDRIATLRMGWLRQVEAQLSSTIISLAASPLSKSCPRSRNSSMFRVRNMTYRDQSQIADNLLSAFFPS